MRNLDALTNVGILGGELETSLEDVDRAIRAAESLATWLRDARSAIDQAANVMAGFEPTPEDGDELARYAVLDEHYRPVARMQPKATADAFAKAWAKCKGNGKPTVIPEPYGLPTALDLFIAATAAR